MAPTAVPAPLPGSDPSKTPAASKAPAGIEVSASKVPEQSLEARAKALFQEGKRTEALACFEQQAAQQPSNAWWLIWQIVCLQALGRWSEALARLAQVPQEGSMVLETWRKRFSLLRASGQLPQAALMLAQMPLPQGLQPLELEQRQLELARSYRDQPRVLACLDQLLQLSNEHPDVVSVEQLQRWRDLRLETLVVLGAAEADQGVAAMDASNGPARRERGYTAMRLALGRGQLQKARQLASTIDADSPGLELVSRREQSLTLAYRIALATADLRGAETHLNRIRELLAASEDKDQLKRVGAEPLRQWRLELGADAALAEELVKLGEEASVASLAKFHLHNGGPTVTSFALIRALAKPQGPITKPNQPDPEGLIPRRLWLLKAPGDSRPTSEQDLQQHCRITNPGWLLDSRQATATTADDQWADLPRLVQAAASCINDHISRGDLMAMALIWRYGGVVLEPRSLTLQPLDLLLGGGAGLVVVADSLGQLQLPLLAARPRHPAIGAALEQACRTVLRGEAYSRWDATLEVPLSRAIANWLAPQLADQPAPSGMRLLRALDLPHWLGQNLELPGYKAPTAARLFFNANQRIQAMKQLREVGKAATT